MQVIYILVSVVAGGLMTWLALRLFDRRANRILFDVQNEERIRAAMHQRRRNDALARLDAADKAAEKRLNETPSNLSDVIRRIGKGGRDN